MPRPASGALIAAAAAVSANLRGAIGCLADPLGLGLSDPSDRDAVASKQGVHSGTFGAMEARFDGRAGAFAYLLFVLLYFPCVATIGVIVREAGARWAGFVAAWTTGVAFATATLFYQVATFERHPVSSGAWVIGLVVAPAVVLLGLRAWGQNGRGAPGAPGALVARLRA